MSNTGLKILTVTDPAQDEQLKSTYKSLGDFFKNKTAKPAQGFVITTTELTKSIGLATSAKHIVYNGGLETRFLEFNLYDGSRRANKQVPKITEIN